MAASSFTGAQAPLRTALLPVLAALVLLPAPARGQGTTVGFLPRAGAFLQTGSLGAAPVSTQVPGTAPSSRRAELGAGAIFGFGLVLDRGGPVLLRADVDWAPGLPVRLDDRRSTFDGTMALITAGVMTRPAGAGPVRPYVSGGVGLRSYRFQPWASAGPQLPDHRLDFALRVGAGAEVPIGPLTLTADAQDLVSSFRFDEVQGAGGERKLQNDLALLVGLRFRIH
jgi:hypothetical protein